MYVQIKNDGRIKNYYKAKKLETDEDFIKINFAKRDNYGMEITDKDIISIRAKKLTIKIEAEK